MNKKEEFKNFISNHPELMTYIKNKEMSFQDFYEIYDIYGENSNVWNKYFNRSLGESTKDKVNELTSILKNVNMDNIEKYVNNAGKAISILQELTKKTPENITKISNPIGKFYGE